MRAAWAVLVLGAAAACGGGSSGQQSATQHPVAQATANGGIGGPESTPSPSGSAVVGFTARQTRLLNEGCQSLHLAVAVLSNEGDGPKTKKEIRQLLLVAAGAFIEAKPPKWHLITDGFRAGVDHGTKALPELRKIGRICQHVYGFAD